MTSPALDAAGAGASRIVAWNAGARVEHFCEAAGGCPPHCSQKARRTHVSLSEPVPHVTVDGPLPPRALSVFEALGALRRAPPHHGVASEPAGGQWEDGLLARACGACPLPGCVPCLARRVEAAPWGVLRHPLLRRHGEIGRPASLVAMSPGPILEVAPTDFHEVLPKAGPGPCSSNALAGSRAAPLPRDREAGAHSRVRHHRRWGRPLLACAARVSPRAACVPWWGLVHGGIPLTLAAQGQGPMVWWTPWRGLAGAIASVAPEAQGVGRNPAYQARLHTIPLRRAVRRRQDRPRPGPCRDRPLHEHRDHPPLMPPGIGGITVTRPHPIARPALAQHLGAGRLGHRLVACHDTGLGGPPGSRRNVSQARAKAHADQRRVDNPR